MVAGRLVKNSDEQNNEIRAGNDNSFRPNFENFGCQVFNAERMKILHAGDKSGKILTTSKKYGRNCTPTYFVQMPDT